MRTGFLTVGEGSQQRGKEEETDEPVALAWSQGSGDRAMVWNMHTDRYEICIQTDKVTHGYVRTCGEQTCPYFPFPSLDHERA